MPSKAARCIPTHLGFVLSAQIIVGPSVYYTIIYHPLKGWYDMSWMIPKSYCTNKWLRFNHARYFPRPIGSVLSAHKILDPSAHYPILDHSLMLVLAQPNIWYATHDYKELLYQEIPIYARWISKTHWVCPVHTWDITQGRSNVHFIDSFLLILHKEKWF